LKSRAFGAEYRAGSSRLKGWLRCNWYADKFMNIKHLRLVSAPVKKAKMC
jgi:hypothetical protein